MHGAEEASVNQWFLRPQREPGEPSDSADPIQHILAAGRNTHEQLDHRKSKRVSEKNIYFCLIDYAKAFDRVDHRGKFFKKSIPDHITYLLRSLYAGQETTVRIGHGTTDWFQIGKGVRQGYILSPCLFNLYAGTSCEMKHKLELRLLEEISITADMQMTPPLWWKAKRN